MPDPTRFPALADIEKDERDRLTQKKADLVAKNHLVEAQRIDDILTNHPLVVDSLYFGLQEQFELTGQPIGDHVLGDLPSQKHPHAAAAVAGAPAAAGAAAVAGAPAAPAAAQRATHPLLPNERAFAAVYGMLLRDGRTPPPMDAPSFLVQPQPPKKPPVPDRWDENDERYRRFVKAVAEARGEYNARSDLYDKILTILARMGNLVGHNDVDLKQWALVGDALTRQRITADDFQLALRVQAAIGYSDPEDGAPSAITINLPDLDAQADLQIIRDNVVATQALYFSAALDDMQFFGVADKIRELFQLGMLPFGKSRGGDLIFAYTKKGINRMTEFERRNLYARTFGFPGGDPTVVPN